MAALPERSVLAMLAGTACFVGNDALVKWVRGFLPASQLMTVRGVLATILLLAIALLVRERIQWSLFARRPMLLRAWLDAMASMAFVTAVAHLALANATAIIMATPLLLTLLAVVLLRERVSPANWLAVVAGFAGVLLVVQPSGHDFNAWSAVVFASAALTACRDLATRRIGAETPSLLVTLSSVVLITVASAVWGLSEEWQPIRAAQFWALAGSSILMSCGYFLITVALREGKISVVAPLRYSALIFSAALGFGIWGDVPSGWALSGMLLTAAAGIFLARR